MDEQRTTNPRITLLAGALLAVFGSGAAAAQSAAPISAPELARLMQAQSSGQGSNPSREAGCGLGTG